MKSIMHHKKPWSDKMKGSTLNNIDPPPPQSQPLSPQKTTTHNQIAVYMYINHVNI